MLLHQGDFSISPNSLAIWQTHDLETQTTFWRCSPHLGFMKHCKKLKLNPHSGEIKNYIWNFMYWLRWKILDYFEKTLFFVKRPLETEEALCDGSSGLRFCKTQGIISIRSSVYCSMSCKIKSNFFAAVEYLSKFLWNNLFSWFEFLSFFGLAVAQTTSRPMHLFLFLESRSNLFF